jgi:Pentapeptide repeats (8 copies)
MIFSIRSVWGELIHQVEVGDRKMQILGSVNVPHWIDLRNLDFTNANLRGADLQGANLEGAILLGANLTEANLERANLKNVDARYCDFAKANLRGTNLENAQMYPSETIGAKFYGAKFLPDSDAAYYARIAHEEMIKKMRIHPNSVAHRKLHRINSWTSPAPSPDIPPAKRGRPCWFFESL